MSLVPVGQRLVHLLELLELLLGNLVIVENLDIVLRDALDLALLILAEMLRGELVDGIVEDEHLIALLDVLGKDGAPKDRVLRVARQIENRVLVVLHAANVLIKRDKSIWLLRCVESKTRANRVLYSLRTYTHS